MIAVDTNLLLYAHREDSPWHEAATACLTELAREPWAIPWPCIHEFLAIATHPRVFDPPSPLADALAAVESWRSVATLSLLQEVDGYWNVLADTLRASRVAGPRIHDARIAALCIQHAVSELWTADRDFSRFARLTTRNPLAGKSGKSGRVAPRTIHRAECAANEVSVERRHLAAPPVRGRPLGLRGAPRRGRGATR